jgi:NADPH:quinone reductase-like Zn-dependent oxidoreductase
MTSGVAGTSGVGKVTKVGPSTTGFLGGDNVLVVSDGCWQDSGVYPANAVYKLPADVSLEEAARLPSALSAYTILTKYVKLSSGDTVVQTHADTSIGAFKER